MNPKITLFLRKYALGYAIILCMWAGLLQQTFNGDLLAYNNLLAIVLIYTLLCTITVALTIHAYKTLNNKWYD